MKKFYLGVLILLAAMVAAQALTEMQECGKIQSAADGGTMSVMATKFEENYIASITIGSQSMAVTSSQMLQLRANWTNFLEQLPSIRLNDGQTKVLYEEKTVLRYRTEKIGIGAMKPEGASVKAFWIVSSQFDSKMCFIEPKDFSRCTWIVNRACDITSGLPDPGAFKFSEPSASTKLKP